jgi:fatty-acyl-CoA synthase
MLGLMQDTPLLLSTLLEHAARNHADSQIVSEGLGGTRHRYTYADLQRRAKKLANALRELGISGGERVATLAWNTSRHLEIWAAVTGIGAVCHTINPRLFFDQIKYIIEHAQDSLLCFDMSLLSLVEALQPQLSVRCRYVVMTDRAGMPTSSIPDLLCYEDLLAAHSDVFEWPPLAEARAATLCYTSGTTGNPKGVLYSHRSCVLHALAAALPDALCISAQDTVMPVVPMYHANAWGIPHVAMLTGAKLVLPGRDADGESLRRILIEEQVTFSAGVPTVWLGLLQYLESSGTDVPSLARIAVGGSAVPRSMIERFAHPYGVEVRQVWGMTELSPLGTICALKGNARTLSPAQQVDVLEKQGRALYGVAVKITDDSGNELPWDGTSSGRLKVRGPWAIERYYRNDESTLDAEGWFDTGDVATLDADGYMRITDRAKDLIKSGGEWISSVQIENAAVGHPDVAEAAVIGVPHPRWDERPLLLIVPKPGSAPTRAQLLEFLAERMAKWWLPDDVVCIEELPHTATGKLLKTRLREAYKHYRLPT